MISLNDSVGKVEDSFSDKTIYFWYESYDTTKLHGYIKAYSKSAQFGSIVSEFLKNRVVYTVNFGL